jgi:hypothetical protein
MQRRRFLSSSIAAGALAASTGKTFAAQANSGREFYELRCFKMQSGEQPRLAHKYFAEALIPALNRQGLKTIGAFDLYLGPETPTIYLLIPSTSLEALVTSELKLAHDDEYLKAAEPFDAAPAKQPAFSRIESSLMIAFEGYPKLTVTPATEKKGARVFQLRTYDVQQRRIRHLCQSRLLERFLWRYTHWRAPAQSHLYGQLPRPLRTRRQMEGFQ